MELGNRKMNIVCDMEKCAGCMACVDICPQNAIQVLQGLRYYQAVIDEKRCTDCGACRRVCQGNESAPRHLPILWQQGWAADEKLRSGAASGGLASALSRQFINEGGLVWSCTFDKGEFRFREACSQEDLRQFAGSRYVKSDARGSYRAIRRRLEEGRRVLFIGLSCQVSALRNFVGRKLEVQLYTVDLICHGTPAPRTLSLFLQQYGEKLSELQDIRFRKGNNYQLFFLHKDGSVVSPVPEGVKDPYSIAYSRGLACTENCYACAYAKEDRVSDITLGDSWGSELPRKEREKGISLVLCQTAKGMELLKKSAIHLEAVDREKSIVGNYHLEMPLVRPEKQELFMKGLEKGKRFNALVRKCCPRQYYNNCYKKVQQLLVKK